MDKRVLVLGLGRSGVAAANLLRDKRARVVALDEDSSPALEKIADQLRSRGIEVLLGVRQLEVFAFDAAVVSPGISPDQPIVHALAARGLPIIGELELGFLHCPCPIVAVTGTNGKTTTTELVEQVLRAGGKRTLAAGNIGYALCDAVRREEAPDVLSVEVSSFQLETIKAFRPRVSIMLNITPDHLDRYTSMRDYTAAKARIFENQTADDFAIINSRTMSQLAAIGVKVAARTILFSDCGGHADYTFRDNAIWMGTERVLAMAETHLTGPHNAQNIMAALAVAAIFRVPPAAARQAICAYQPLPHRCEYVATIDGVDYINDSKATNPDAVEKALQGMTRPVVLIAGGKDKGFDFSVLRPALKEKVRRVILIGETSQKLLKSWGDVVECHQAASMEEAVSAAKSSAQAGDCVLLSPACSSFDMFENFEDRGEQFKRIVRRVSEKQSFASANNPTQRKDS